MAAQDNGNWFKLYRGILDNTAWAQGSNIQRVLMITLLAKAWWKPGKYIWAGRVVHMQPGQLITTITELTELCNASRRSLRTALDCLKAVEFLTIQSTRRGILVSIVNWGKYQLDAGANDQPNDQPTTIDRPTSDQPTSPYNMYKNIKEGEEGKKIRRKEGKNIYSPLPQFEEFAGGNQPLLDALKGWADMRRQIKKPLTERAVSLALKRLQDISGGQEKIMVAILDQSTMNNWSGLFPLKDNRREYSRPGNSPEEMEAFKNGVEYAVSNGFWHG